MSNIGVLQRKHPEGLEKNKLLAGVFYLETLYRDAIKGIIINNKKRLLVLKQRLYSTLLNADIKLANGPNAHKDGEQTREDGERLAKCIRNSVVIDHLENRTKKRLAQ